MNAKTAMVARALELLGCGYIYGATGWICTRARIEQQAKQYPAQADNIRKYGEKWLNKACYDCAQFVRAVCKVAGVSLPSGSTSQWRSDNFCASGTIADMPRDESCLLVFRMKPGTVNTTEHVGVYLGDGTTAEARGHAYGCVRRNLDDGTWTHFKRLKVFAAAEPETAPPQGSYTDANAVDDIAQILMKVRPTR